jgi:acylphosphatase
VVVQTDNRNNKENHKSQLHVIVEGRVQGVGFRAFTQRTAINYGLSGWVRNRWDGSVELMAEGQNTDLEKFLITIKRGPFPGTTRNVRVVWKDASGGFTNFLIKWSG